MRSSTGASALEQLGDLAIRVPTKIGELDRAAFAFGEIGQRPPDRLAFAELGDGALEIVVDRRAAERLPLLARPSGRLRAQQIHRSSVHLGEQERAHRTPTRVEPVGPTPEPEKYLLHHLLCEHAVGEDPTGEAKARTRVARVQLPQRQPISVGDDTREVTIGGRAPLRVRHGVRAPHTRSTGLIGRVD